MLTTSKTHALPAGVEQALRRVFGFAWGARSQPVPVVSDEQIVALVAAAQALSERQRERNRHAAVTSGVANERLRRLDWAVRAGGIVLAERAGLPARAYTPPPPAWAA